MNSCKSILMMALALLATAAAQAEVVVVVNPKHPAASMSAEEIADIYLGKNAAFTPTDLPESAAPRNEFYGKVVRKDAAQVRVIWARLIFTGKTTPPRQVDSSAAAVKFVASNERGIAYVEKSALDATVKAVLTIQ
jgi:ABC-type phosphate transport system substrate-binding protein